MLHSKMQRSDALCNSVVYLSIATRLSASLLRKDRSTTCALPLIKNGSNLLWHKLQSQTDFTAATLSCTTRHGMNVVA